MDEFATLMFKPLLACIILTGVHAYLGIHVLKREVIFVDLALAQIAALGSTFGFLFGYELHSGGGYFISLAFTLCGAAVFSLTRFQKQVVPHEALIGIVYAVAAAASILVLSRTPDGGEELKSLLVGHLLFVGNYEIGKIALIYSIIGVIHYVFRKEFFLLSENPQEASKRGLSIRFWDFLFYATFGFVVTSSVEIAGVLLVFSFLIVPAVCAAFLSTKFNTRLFLGWIIGVVASIAGISVSYFYDLPTGAAVVCVFGILAVLSIGFGSSRQLP